MPDLQRLSAAHESAVLAFELENRVYFAASVSDRGDDYFTRFADGFRALLAEQDSRVCAYFVLVEPDGSVVGRFNLYDLADGAATVGYRVAQRVAGRGVATTALGELCLRAAGLGLCTLTAATSEANLASQRVLLNAGFVAAGPADPGEVGGRSGVRFRRELSPPARC